MSRGYLTYSYYLNFHQGTFRKTLYCDCRTGRIGRGEEFCIYRIHIGKVSDVGQEDSCLYNVSQSEASLLEDSINIGE